MTAKTKKRPVKAGSRGKEGPAKPKTKAEKQPKASKRKAEQPPKQGPSLTEGQGAQESPAAGQETAGTAKGQEPGKMSLLDAAHEVLKSANAPMTVADMLGQAEHRGLWTRGKGKTPANTLAAGISTEIKKQGGQSRFVKVERGQFRTADWVREIHN